MNINNNYFVLYLSTECICKDLTEEKTRSDGVGSYRLISVHIVYIVFVVELQKSNCSLSYMYKVMGYHTPTQKWLPEKNARCIAPRVGLAKQTIAHPVRAKSEHNSATKADIGSVGPHTKLSS